MIMIRMRIFICWVVLLTLSYGLCLPDDDIFNNRGKSFSDIVRDRLGRDIDIELGSSKKSFKSKPKEQGRSIFDSFPLDEWIPKMPKGKGLLDYEKDSNQAKNDFLSSWMDSKPKNKNRQTYSQENKEVAMADSNRNIIFNVMPVEEPNFFIIKEQPKATIVTGYNYVGSPEKIWNQENKSFTAGRSNRQNSGIVQKTDQTQRAQEPTKQYNLVRPPSKPSNQQFGRDGKNDDMADSKPKTVYVESVTGSSAWQTDRNSNLRDVKSTKSVDSNFFASDPVDSRWQSPAYAFIPSTTTYAPAVGGMGGYSITQGNSIFIKGTSIFDVLEAAKNQPNTPSSNSNKIGQFGLASLKKTGQADGNIGGKSEGVFAEAEGGVGVGLSNGSYAVGQGGASYSLSHFKAVPPKSKQSTPALMAKTQRSPQLISVGAGSVGAQGIVGVGTGHLKTAGGIAIANQKKY